MIELALPELEKESKSAKDLVISSLLEESPLSLIQLHNRIKKSHNVSITYQAVRKAVDLLGEKGIIQKDGRNYSLNKKWFIKLKSFVDRVVQSDQKINVKQFHTVYSQKQYMTFTLNSLFELDNFWGDVLKYLSNNLTKDEKKISVNIGHHAWWILINLGRESELYTDFQQKKIKTRFVLFAENSINQHAKKLYESLNHKVILTENQKQNSLEAINTVGDSIIQITYPATIMKKVDKLFRDSDLTNIDMKKITKLVHERCEIHFAIFKNKEFAQNFNDKYLRYFEKS